MHPDDPLRVADEPPGAHAPDHELRQSERQLRQIVDALPTLVAYVDAEQRYRFVNAAYERWFGRPRADFEGKHVADVLGHQGYEAVRSHVERALAGEAVSYEADVPYRVGGLRAIEATYVPQPADAGGIAGYVSLVADIGERKSFERFRLGTAERSERLLRITAAIAEAVTSHEVLEAGCDHVAEAVGASSAALWLTEEDEGTARLVRTLGHGDALRQRFAELRIDAPASSPAQECLRHGEPIFISSQQELVRRYPDVRAAVTPGRSYRVSCLPLAARGRRLGVLALTIEEARETTDDERHFLMLAARYTSQAVERMRLFEAERRSRKAALAAATRMEVLGRASRAFVESSLDFTSTLDRVTLEVGAALGSVVGVALLQADGRLHTASFHHPVPDARERLLALGLASPLRLGEGVTGTVASTGQSVLIPSMDPAAVRERVSPAYRAYLELHPIYGMMCVPLRTGGRIIGAITASQLQEGVAYTPEDLRMLEELAERAAAAIENSRLHREVVDARARAEQLYRFARSVVEAGTVEHVFEAAMDAIEATLGARRSAIVTFEPDGTMRFRAWRGLSDEYRAAVRDHLPWPRDAAAPEPLLVPNAEAEPSLSGFAPLFRREGIGALAFIPLVSGGRLLGKFMIYHDRPHAHAAHEVETAHAIANHLASVTQRFTLLAELQETIRYNEIFAGILAHDLRNPLGAMMTAAQLLLRRQQGENEKLTKPLTRIVSSGERMARMIEQLLDLTRARVGGGIAVVPQETNLADLCTQVMDEITLVYPDWVLVREVQGDATGAWDPDRMLQVVSNLLANAGLHGKPDSGVRLRIDGTSPEHVVLEIHNDGAIPAILLPSIFDPFRGTRYQSGHSRGLGLGLFITQQIVLGHGGSMDVRSTEADGTTFIVRLPRRSVPSGKPITTAPS